MTKKDVFMRSNETLANGERFKLDPKLAKASARVFAKAAKISSTLPSASLADDSPKVLRRLRLKLAARKEAKLGLLVIVDNGIVKSPWLNIAYEEEAFHLSRSYDEWSELVDEIANILRPYQSVIETYDAVANKRTECAEAAAKAAHDEDLAAYGDMEDAAIASARRYHAERARQMVFDSVPLSANANEDIANAAFQIKASGLLELLDSIVGNGNGGGLALARAVRIQQKLSSRQNEWISWAGVPITKEMRFPALDVSFESKAHCQFFSQYKSLFRGMRDHVDLV